MQKLCRLRLPKKKKEITHTHAHPPHTHTMAKNYLFPLTRFTKISLSINCGGPSGWKLPFIFACNNPAADKYVSNVYKRPAKIQNKYYAHKQNGKWQKSMKTMDNHDCSSILIFKHKNEKADIVRI